MVHRTQVSHMPDPFDPTPVKQGITVYYTELNVGGVSFAVIADRMFKSARATHRRTCSGRRRLDHVPDPNFDTRCSTSPA